MTVRFVTPTRNQREVNLDSSINFVIESDKVILETLNVYLNSVPAILGGVFQRQQFVFGSSPEAIGEIPETSTRFYLIPNSSMKVGDQVLITDFSEQIETQIVSIDNDVYEFRHAFQIPETLPSNYSIEISSISRGYQGSIALIANELDVVINSLEDFRPNSTYFLIVEYQDKNDDLNIYDVALIPQSSFQREVITFRTIDNQGPQIKIPKYINNSILNIDVVDLQGSFISLDSLLIKMNNEKIVENRVLHPDYNISIVQKTQSHLQIAIIKKIAFTDKEMISLLVECADDLGNKSSKSYFVTNFAPKVEDQILPEEEEVTQVPNLIPIVKNFFPLEGVPTVTNTDIRFLIQSEIPGAPLVLNSISVFINNSTIAINNGVFTTGFSGSIVIRDSSNGNAINIVLRQSILTEGEAIITIVCDDAAGNHMEVEKQIIVTSELQPLVQITPLGGKYNTYQRVEISASQPSTIYYTTDGSQPEIGRINTFTGTAPVQNIPLFSDGNTQVRAFAINQYNVRGPTQSVLYELNTKRPIVTISSPINNVVLNKGLVTVNYSIVVKKGYLVKVEQQVNSAARIDLDSTILISQCSVVGLRSGFNVISIIATDNFGNEGIASVSVLVNPTQIENFGITYAPLKCPNYTNRIISDVNQSFDKVDTETVAIIGLGRRTETLVNFALGDGQDGNFIDFLSSGEKDGRHFQLQSFPIEEIEVRLYRKGRIIILDVDMYKLNTGSGQLVLDHPVEFGEGLFVDYISEKDINNPQLYLSKDLNKIYERFGNPSTENTLSLACQLAFENGAQRIIAIQGEKLANDPFWTNSFAALEKEECYWICPVIDLASVDFYSGLILSGYNHCEKMSRIDRRKERILCAGLGKQEANEIERSRVYFTFLHDDAKIVRIISGENQELHRSMLGVCIAGKGSSFSPETPLKYKSFTGVTIQSTQKLPQIDADLISEKGLMLIHPLQFGGKIEMGRTGYVGVTNPVLEELSVQRVVDNISKRLRVLLQNRFVGMELSKKILQRIKADCDEFLQKQTSMISLGKVDAIQIDSKDPRQVNLSVAINPLYPLNKFSIQITVNAKV